MFTLPPLPVLLSAAEMDQREDAEKKLAREMARAKLRQQAAIKTAARTVDHICKQIDQKIEKNACKQIGISSQHNNYFLTPILFY